MNIVEKMSDDLKLDKDYISKVISHSQFYYKDYTIPKKNGGYRYISQPSPELKTLQYWVLNNILCKLPVSRYACAYKTGDSIKKHALHHKDSKYIFHADLCNFFSSIHFAHLKLVLNNCNDIFTNLGIDLDSSLEYINKICFRNDSLCIGAVSSPIISNIIMFALDTAIARFCDLNNYIYTRYADDIYISSKTFIDKNILDFISKKLQEYNFKLNKKKTRFYSPKYRRKITGLILTDDSQISIGTERRNDIKKMVYEKLVYNRGDSNQIIGCLSFLKNIEPVTYDNLIIKYSKYCKEDIIAQLKSDD